jgi:hypothetical protein
VPSPVQVHAHLRPLNRASRDCTLPLPGFSFLFHATRHGTSVLGAYPLFFVVGLERPGRICGHPRTVHATVCNNARDLYLCVVLSSEDFDL